MVGRTTDEEEEERRGLKSDAIAADRRPASFAIRKQAPSHTHYGRCLKRMHRRLRMRLEC